MWAISSLMLEFWIAVLKVAAAVIPIIPLLILKKPSWLIFDVRQREDRSLVRPQVMLWQKAKESLAFGSQSRCLAL